MTPTAFQSKEYHIVRGILSKKNAKQFYQYAVKKARSKDGVQYDNQLPSTPSIYKDPKFSKLQVKLHKKIEKLTGYKLFKTYNYFRVYKNQDILRIHTDRPACEISLTMHLGGDKPWSIFLLDKDEQPIEVKLKPGDILLYNGIQRPHWRPKFDGTVYAQVFMHFVDQNGIHAAQKDDAAVRR